MDAAAVPGGSLCHPSLPPGTVPVAVPDAVAGDAVLSGVGAALSREALVMESPHQCLLVASGHTSALDGCPEAGAGWESWVNVGANGIDQGPALQSKWVPCADPGGVMLQGGERLSGVAVALLPLGLSTW